MKYDNATTAAVCNMSRLLWQLKKSVVHFQYFVSNRTQPCTHCTMDCKHCRSIYWRNGWKRAFHVNMLMGMFILNIDRRDTKHADMEHGIVSSRNEMCDFRLCLIVFDKKKMSFYYPCCCCFGWCAIHLSHGYRYEHRSCFFPYILRHTVATYWELCKLRRNDLKVNCQARLVAWRNVGKNGKVQTSI